MLLVDFDGFRRINDESGHAVGDLLLRQIGARLAGRVRDTDMLARIRGRRSW